MTECSTIQLKVFSGPHLGAEIPLNPGTFIIGSNASCDIILQDSAIAPRHLQIIVPAINGEGIQIKTLDAPVVMDIPGGELESDPVQEEDAVENGGDRSRVQGEAHWQSFSPMMLGTSCLAWKEGGENWAGFSHGALVEGFFPGSKEVPGEEEILAEAVEPKTIKIPPLGAKILKGLGILIIGLFLFGPCMGIRDTHLARDMADILEDADFDYLKVNQTAIGVTVLGTVETQADRSRLWQIAGKADYPVFIDVMVKEERAYAVKVALSVRGLFPEVSLDGGDVLMKGYMRDKLIEGAAKVWVKKDIFQVDQVRSSMVYAFQVWPVLKDRLLKYHLEKKVVIRFHPGLVQVQGELDFDQRKALEKVKEEVCKALQSPIAFWDSLTAPGFSDEWNASLNSSLKSQFAPDSALSQLFMDSQSAKGVPALKASAPAYRANQTLAPVSLAARGASLGKTAIERLVKAAKKIVNAQGNHLALLTDKKGRTTGAVLLDKDDKIAQGEKGTPVFLSPLLDEDGKVVLGGDKNPVMGHLARDRDGKVILNDQGKPKVLGTTLDKEGEGILDSHGNRLALLTDKDGRVAGTVFLDGDGTIVRDGGGDSVFLEPAVDGHGNVVLNRSGNPVMNRLALDGDGNPVLAPPGNPVVLGLALDGDGKVVKDAQGDPIPLTLARDAAGAVVRDEGGNPILVPALLDRAGRLIRGVGENFVAPRVITGAGGRPVHDRQGNLLLDRDANKVFDPLAGPGNMVGTTPDEDRKSGKRLQDNSMASLPSDKKVFGSGTVVADKIGKTKEIDPLQGLSIVSITLEPIPFVAMKDGQKFFTGGKLPSGYVIKRIATDHIELERKGKIKILRMRQ